jgi:DnaK suppressor protein
MDQDRARELLAAERERIERDLASLDRPEGRGAEEAEELDPADRGRDLYEDELDEGRRESLREQLSAVERAEQRLADGTYGRSILSGEAIPDERLEALPAAELTVAEAEEQARR